MAVTPPDSPAKQEARKALYTEITRQVGEIQGQRADHQPAMLRELSEAYAHVAGAPATEPSRAYSA